MQPSKKIIFYLCLLLLETAIPHAFAHGVKYHEFTPIDRRVGMDASIVYCAVQDHQGLIWMGTNQGLYSYDGYSARYHSSPLQGHNGVIYCAFMPDSMHIWLGGESGLVVFNTLTDRFEPTPQGLPQNIRSIVRLNQHHYWIGSMNGLFRYNAQTGKVDKMNDAAIPHQAIYAILRYDENTFYFGTYDGLCRYDAIANKFERVALGSQNRQHNQLILSLLADYDRNRIWVGVEGGLFAYSPSTGVAAEMALFKGNSIKSLFIDNQKCLWAGTDNGLFIYDPILLKHRVIRHDALNDRSLVNNIVWTVYSDKEQNIWLGTDAGVSLYVYNDRYKVQSISELTGSNEGNQLISLLADSQGRLWLGGTNGLILVDKLRGKTVWFQQNSAFNPIPHNKVRHVFEDADGDIWIATDGSICRYDEKSSAFVRYQIEDATHQRNANWAYAICQDETRKLWVATCLGGVFVVDKQKMLASSRQAYVAERNYYVNSGANALSGTMLQYLWPDADQNMWAGTYRAGINKIDRSKQRVVQFTAASEAHPLPSDEVTAMTVGTDGFVWIALRDQLVRMGTRDHQTKVVTDSRLAGSYINAMADDGKRIWMSSTTGLYVMDKHSLTLKKVNAGASFYSAVHYNPQNRTVVAGGMNEYVVFIPEQVLDEDERNRLFLTSLWVNDRLVQHGTTVGTPVELTQSIRFTNAIELPHHLNNLSFAFSELVYNQGEGVQYAYKLSGVDSDWRFTSGTGNRLAYNSLRPGDYVLAVSRINAEGKPMANPLKFSVKIWPPWYASLWAKLVYSVLFVGLILVIVNYFMVLNRLRYERLEKVKTLELASHKIEFLTNISHELKTPLSLIIGPLSKVVEQVKAPEVKEQLVYVKQNATKLNALIHQLMEAARQQTDGFGLIVSEFDMVEFMKSVTSVFEKPLADKGARVTLVTGLRSFAMEGDVLKIEAIMNNIMSNAVKFAPEGSEVLVEIVEMPQGVGVSVTDQGPGIAANDLPYIFDRFFQSKDTIRMNKEGSGVGLSIVKNYVDLHHGKVQAFSSPEAGTRLLVYLPAKQNTRAESGSVAASTDTPLAHHPQNGKPTLLIVEDNHEILMFIANHMAAHYTCLTAHNGKIGLDMAIAQRPDVVVTDIMMPVMDGIEMCRKLKENIATASIPVLMLTAKDDKQTEMMSYQIGADGFVPKPFEIDYLLQRVKQLLQSRKHLVDKARQEAIIKPGEIREESADERFLAHITKVIEEQITDSDLNVNALAEKTGYNPKQVYRRIKALTGQTAVDYIRSVRLKKAAMLLKRKTFTVAEVMYMVGFNNHSYFAKRFQELYGKPPKEYMEEVG
jgi:ligand-binding sensor domain-containing protein/signal transduction histidine kinase/DNA-binding response OmpR family regulator